MLLLDKLIFSYYKHIKSIGKRMWFNYYIIKI